VCFIVAWLLIHDTLLASQRLRQLGHFLTGLSL
jgi:hypothetical protein